MLINQESDSTGTVGEVGNALDTPSYFADGVNGAPGDFSSNSLKAIDGSGTSDSDTDEDDDVSGEEEDDDSDDDEDDSSDDESDEDDDDSSDNESDE